MSVLTKIHDDSDEKKHPESIRMKIGRRKLLAHEIVHLPRRSVPCPALHQLVMFLWPHTRATCPSEKPPYGWIV